MGKKALWLLLVFAAVTAVALVKGEPVPTAALVGAAFTVPLLVTLAMPAWTTPTNGLIVVGVVSVFGPDEPDDAVRSWFQLWLVVMGALLVAGIWTLIENRRRRPTE